MAFSLAISSLIGVFVLFQSLISSYSYFRNGNNIQDLNDYRNELNIANDSSQWIPTGNLMPIIHSDYFNGSNFALGGLGICGSLCSYTRIFTNLPEHDIIYFDFVFIMYHNWNLTDVGIMEFDGYQMVFLYDSKRVAQNNGAIYVNGKVLHNNSSINITLFYNTSTNGDGALGLRNLNLNFGNKTEFENESSCSKRSGNPRKAPTCGSCSEGYYRHTNGSCVRCHLSCKSCNGPASSDCGQFVDGHILNGVKCPNINTTCYSTEECDMVKYPAYQEKTWLGTCEPSITTIKQLTTLFSCSNSCQSNECLYPDGNCATTCEYPLAIYVRYNMSFCEYPCLRGLILNINGSCLISCGYPLLRKNYTHGPVCEYPCNGIIIPYNDTCVSSCSYPLANITNEYGRICAYPCQSSYFFYQNGSCLNSCQYPLIQKDYTYGKLCEYPCKSNEILSFYGVCVTSCSFPFIQKSNQYGRFCGFAGICSSDQVLLYNNTCLPRSSCIIPLTIKTYGSDETCESFCGTAFIHWNLTCRSLCEYPFRQRVSYGLKYCDGPLCGNKTCPRCQKTLECSEGYYCNTFLGGFCVKKEVFLKVELSKTIINGYVLLAQVDPKVEILENIDEILEMKTEGMNTDVDYQVSIQKVEKGVFKITILLLKPLIMKTFPTHFRYSPFRLDLTQDLSLPKIVYMPQETLDKGKQVGSASELSFILIIVSLVVFMVLGKLSNMLSFVMINQYLYSLLYLNANYLEHTLLYLRSLKNYNALLPKSEIVLNSILEHQLKLSLPKRFFEEQYSTSFFSNSIQIVGIICITISFLMVLCSLLENLKSPPKFLQKLKFSLRWNGIIRQIVTYSLPLTIASLIQVHVSVFGRNGDLFSLLASLICLFLFFVSFIKMLFIISKIPYSLTKRVLYADRYGALWKGLNLEGMSKYYYWISMARGLLLAYMTIFFELFPVIQISVLMLYQFGILVLFFGKVGFKRVMTDRDQNFVSFMLEFALLVTKGLILAHWILNRMYVNENALIMIGWVIIGSGVFIQGIQATYSLYMQIRNWKKIWQSIKSIFVKSKKRKVKRIKNTMRIYEPNK